MPRYAFRLPDVVVDRTWCLGPVRLRPALELRSEIDAMHAERPPPTPAHEALRDDVAEIAEAWTGDAVLEVEAHDSDAAVTRGQEAIAIIRLFLRPEVAVNVDIHRIGLEGDLISAVREYILVHDEHRVVAYGGERVGGSVAFQLGSEVLDKWDSDIRLHFLADQLGKPDTRRSEAGQKSITSILMLDTAFRAIEPSVRVLGATIAIEVLLSRASPEGWQPQSFPIARRVAYLTCKARCGHEQPLCPYTKPRHKKNSPFKQLLADVELLAEQEQEWRCSAFLHVAAPVEVIDSLRHSPLFTVRNEVAHNGRTSLNEAGVRRLRQLADDIVFEALYWFASHPSGSIAILDQEMDSKN